MKDNRKPDFNLLLLWAGQVFSQAGTRMYQIALAWWIINRDSGHAGLKMGLLLVLSSLPSILLIKLIGKWVDKYPTKKIIVMADAIAAILTAALAAWSLAAEVQLYHVYALGFVLSFFQALVDPSLNKAVPQIVSKSRTESAVALIVSTTSIANFSGAIFGALCIGFLGIAGSLWVNAASYVLSALFSSRVSFRNKRDAVPAPDGQTDGKIATRTPKQKLLWRLLLGFGLINFFATPTFIVMPVYVKNILGGQAFMLAVAEAGLWLGFISGSIIPKWIRTEKNFITVGGSGLLALGVFLLLTGILVHAVWYPVLLFFAGLSLSVANVKFITLFQNVVEDSVKGRFFARLSAISSFTFPVAFFLFGSLADVFKATQLCLVQGAGVILLSLWYFKAGAREKVLWN
ncbi:MAG: hypothetical protein A2583_15400 [Bdellovibrionales bacterium RIFOXYD1_FULL_53_11]|nr:MAG: hypothetical protein A2583_15400 [Bdellovibrionales bacterium RIFOXYD1_FULL_53_11]